MAGSIFRGPVGIFTLLLSFLVTAIFAVDNTTAASSSATYVYGQNELYFIVSLTAAADTGDIFFAMTAPTGYDWVSFGLGSEMTGAIMFVVYAAVNGTSKWSSASGFVT
jgi:hypothetical protein